MSNQQCITQAFLLMALLIGGTQSLYALNGNPESEDWRSLAPWKVLKGQDLADSLRVYDSVHGGGGVGCLRNYGGTFQVLGYRGDTVWWATTVERCDSVLNLNSKPRLWVLVYHHRIGVIPKVTDCQIIGRDWAIDRSAELLSSGDWDANGYVDLAIRIQKYGDTSDGNVTQNYRRRVAAIYWGSPSGYSDTDSSHLVVGGFSVPVGVYGALNADLNGDGVSDLLLNAQYGIVEGHLVQTAAEHLYLGTRGERWGRSRNRQADIEWWTSPPGVPFLLDQDCDGIKDLVFVSGDDASVAYQSATAWFDTSAVEQITAPGSSRMLFTDLTGDRVPELVCQNTIADEIRVYAGRSGQRLIEQFGSGSDSGDAPDASHSYSRPWKRVWLPHRINKEWESTNTTNPLYAYDANGYGMPDLVSMSYPFLCIYTADPVCDNPGGVGYTLLDSLIDGELDTRVSGAVSGIWAAHGVWGPLRVGDVMGVGRGSGELWLLKPNPELPAYVSPVMLPHRCGAVCDHAAGVEEVSPRLERGGSSSLSFSVVSTVKAGEEQ